VEFVYPIGDLSSGFMSSSRLVEGVKGHQEIQQAKESGESERFVSLIWESERIILELTGRIDHTYVEDSIRFVEEIKTTHLSLSEIRFESFPGYWMQAKLYAFMIAKEESLSQVGVQLTFLQLSSRETKEFSEMVAISQLTTFATDIVEAYIAWQEDNITWKERRNESIQKIQFPFKTWRLGQKELSDLVYQSIEEDTQLFVQAPTGIGKTMAVLYPAIQALSDNHVRKIFYLTAKTVTRMIAENSLDILRQNGLHLRSVTLTAKEKLCFQETMVCDPETCVYAREYYLKSRAALTYLMGIEKLDRSVLEEVGRKFEVCPFELSLDASLQADCIICDYNYVFDPRVFLKRYFQDGGGDFVFLIDEAHNLVERAREMYSAELTKTPFLQLKRDTKARLPKLSKSLSEIQHFFVSMHKECKETERGYIANEEKPKALVPLLRTFLDEAEMWLARNETASFRDNLLTVYFQVFHFCKALDWYDDKFITYYQPSKSDLQIKLFCLDPSQLLAEALEKGKSAIFFSATLTPLDYFRNILGGDSDAILHSCPSPFPRENLFLLLDDKISTKYKDREFSYDRIVQTIEGLARSKPGNYLIFFPSYEYLREVEYRFSFTCPDVRTINQRSMMNELEREDFLNQFEEDVSETLVAFAVMGGLFGEGIDLVGERLSGAVIVGVGLPQICLEREMIKQYFQESRGAGFEFAYVYPGMNKVLQASGRVIRSHTDKGVVILLDERFAFGNYKKLCPEHWHPIPRLSDPKSLQEILKRFWENKT
jgi:DNA excision repair protein ERCC-2